MRGLTKFITLLFLKSCLPQDYPPIIELPLGRIEGFKDNSSKGRTFFSFEGIPYASPPTGKYRFKEPLPVKPWTGTLKANTVYKCMQYYQYTPPGEDFVLGDEDCLYLNVYTPSLTNSSLDVIVNIHGGAFMFNYGAASKPHYLLDKDIVYVNFNYRLGPLGFLSTESDTVPGNNGFKDQQLALKWIKDHIAQFGGNSDSITLVGVSAGGASVHLHYLAPKSRGLFRKGISQSGTTLNSWFLTEKPLETAMKLASAVGCPTEDVDQMVNCLRKRPARQIVQAVHYLQPWLYNPCCPFAAVVDSWSSDPLLPDYPYNLLKKGQVADLPWITSFTNSEGLYPAADFYNDEYLQELDTNWKQLIPFVLLYHHTVEPKVMDRVSDQIRRFYLGEKNLTKSTFMDLVQLIGDRLFVADIAKAALLHASSTTSSVYTYQFAYRGTYSRSESRTGVNTDFGAAHGDDTLYLFKTNINSTSTPEDNLMVDLMVDMVTSFAKIGKPNIFGKWLPLSTEHKDTFSYLKIRSPYFMEMESQQDAGSLQFWASLPIEENEKLHPVKDEL